MMEDNLEPETEPSGLADFLVLWREIIMAAWQAAVRRTEKGRHHTDPVIRDSVPEILDAIADIVRRPGTDPMSELEELPEVHAAHRLEIGVQLDEVVTELTALRGIVLQLHRRH